MEVEISNVPGVLALEILLTSVRLVFHHNLDALILLLNLVVEEFTFDLCAHVFSIEMLVDINGSPCRHFNVADNFSEGYLRHHFSDKQRNGLPFERLSVKEGSID